MSASGWVPERAKFDQPGRKRGKTAKPKLNGHAREHDVEADVAPLVGEELDPNYEALLRSVGNHKLLWVPWKWERGSDWVDQQVPDRLWIMPDWIPRRQVTGIYGIGGVNKTDLVIQLCMAYSRGLPFAGYPLDCGPAIGMFCEDERDEVVRRGNRIAEHYGYWGIGDFPEFHYISLVGFDLPEFMTFDNGRGHAQLALRLLDKKIADTGAKLVVLDTAPHFFGGNEVARREVAAFIRKLDSISITRDCAIVFTAHPSAKGRSSGRMDSGSTHWEGGVRARIALTRPEAEDAEDNKPPADNHDRVLTLWKSNYSAPGKAIDLVWDKGIFTTAALDPEKARARGPGRNAACDDKFLELLRAVDAQGGYVNDSPNQPARYAPAVFAARADGKTFSRPEYKRSMDRLLGHSRLRYERTNRYTKLVEIPATQSDQSST
jgi:RecA-family ATPase